jgi:hypothetical protein
MQEEQFPFLDGKLPQNETSSDHDSDSVISVGSVDTDIGPQTCSLLELPSELTLHMLSFLDSSKELLRVRDVCCAWRRVVVGFNVFERPQFQCFHTKARLGEVDETTGKGAVLGVGLVVTHHRDGHLKDASSPLDLLSLQAFRDEGVRTGVWGGGGDNVGGTNAKFDLFLPLVIDKAHARLAAPIIQRTIFSIMRKVPESHQHRQHRRQQQQQQQQQQRRQQQPYRRHRQQQQREQCFNPIMVLDLLSVLMNSSVVQLMTANSSSTHSSTSGRGRGRGRGQDQCKGGGGQVELVRRYASEKALEGYCAFHHMLLHFARMYPSIRAEANRRVDAFVAHEQHRSKAATPNLGTLLVCMTLSTKGWAPMWRPLLLECFDRNVRWVLQKHPALGSPLSLSNASIGGNADDDRLERTFDASLTSMRLLMFQAHFMGSVGRPAGTTGPDDVLAGYGRRLGRPTTAQKESLQEACRAILGVDSWVGFFERLQVPVPAKPRLIAMLKDAVGNSRRKGYHR